MKNSFFYLLASIFLMFTLSCNNDDDSDLFDNTLEEIFGEEEVIEDEEVVIEEEVTEEPEEEEEEISEEEDVEEIIVEEEESFRTTVVFNEVSFLGTDWIEIYNPTSDTVNVADYWLCLGSGTYRQISSLEILEGEFNLASGGFLLLGGYNLPDDGGGLGLYIDGSFGSSDSMIDFVQYGGGSFQRTDVAEGAGLWNEGNFLPIVADEANTIAYSGNGFGVEFWSETTSPTPGAANEFVAP